MEKKQRDKDLENEKLGKELVNVTKERAQELDEARRLKRELDAKTAREEAIRIEKLQEEARARQIAEQDEAEGRLPWYKSSRKIASLILAALLLILGFSLVFGVTQEIARNEEVVVRNN